MSSRKTVVDFIEQNQQWHLELLLLRETILAQKLDETVKWGLPVYTYQGKNIVGLGTFTSYVGLWFFQGGLLKDNSKRLMNAQDGKTRTMRQWRFKDLSDIKTLLTLIETYINPDYALEICHESSKCDKIKCLTLILTRKRGNHHGEYQN